MSTVPNRGMRALRAAVTALALTAACALVPTASAADNDTDTALYLVALRGTGTSAASGPRTEAAERRTVRQNRVLDDIEAPEPVYRWTTALNGFAVALTPRQVARLRADERVARVERDEVRSLAGHLRTAPDRAVAKPAAARAGRGVVIGVVDTGVAADGPVFARPVGGVDSPRFRGGCDTDSSTDASSCVGKLIGADYFVSGFGRDRIAASASLTPADDNGHGTAVASIAAGNTRVTARASGTDLGVFSGTAPGAAIASYKACWTAPDPADDGCSTADLVSAIDQATLDQVDVLNLSVSGSADLDTVELALLGAAEADIVVVTAAGNQDRTAFAGHASPWVLTVGGARGPLPSGQVRLSDGTTFAGTMAGARGQSETRIVLAVRAAAAGVPARRAAACLPGSLDATAVRDRIVVCERGRIGRVDKSATVALAGGAAMVLVDRHGAEPVLDAHAVPTVHLDVTQGRRLRDRLARDPKARAALRPTSAYGAVGVAAGSSPGDPHGLTVKPDVLAYSVGRLAAAPIQGTSDRFFYASGTSVAAARVAGLAARLRAQHPRWSESAVRSALSTSAQSLNAPLLKQGAGLATPYAGARARLTLEVKPGDYRRVLRGTRPYLALNTASVLADTGSRVLRRTITNRGGRARYFSSSVTGFQHHRVQVLPAAVRLAPGESATFRIRITGSGVRPLDDGFVVWRAADDTQTRIPVVLSR